MTIELSNYGFTGADFLAAQEIIKEKNKPGFIPARIIESQRERFKVICEYGEVSAEIKGSFFHNLENCTNNPFNEKNSTPISQYYEPDAFPVAGDFVVIKYNANGSSLIDAVLPRRSRFSRADFLGHEEGYVKNVKEQVSAANFDYIFIMSSLNLDLNLKRLARYLTASLQSGGFPVFVLTKADLVENASEQIAEVRKIAREVPVITISNKTGFGIDDLSPFLEPAKTVVFLGSSGVGKSSLINRLVGQNVMEVKEIREDDSKGRHTTTYRQIFRLASGALVIDTPGIRELGLWDSKEGISLAFAEIEELFSKCRFNNCAHQTEPGCAVLAALEDGSISAEQWKSYLAQQKETAFTLSHSAYLKQKQQFHKSIARHNRARKKGGYFGD
ncbi:MAG: ribosome small subunit-dependent GTPase A [Treponema sp.]|nr:ribosome small subunit-dependent GTPase A [Treponema sp.]MCL2251752.1 ribosome small subunit-dependent GTPase A [Treponema sp.]